MAVVDGLGVSTSTRPHPTASATTMNYPRTTKGLERQKVHPAVLSSTHVNGANILLGDGSVRFLNQAINTAIYNSLFMIDDGQEIADNF